MNTSIRLASAVSLAALSMPAFAHPGNHADIAAAETAAHVSGSMFHIGMIVIGLAAAVALVQAVRARRAQEKCVRSRARSPKQTSQF